MAATGDPKGFKQDMVVSIRYRNDLPPPPMPPKLLEIDNGGLAQYLTTGFAAAMARREEPNIEADAEGGMPIDMIGIPGYFLGDESAIMAPDIQPVLDPADLALMLTHEQLKSQNSKSANVSFLRRTQYMSSHNARANDPLVRSNPRTAKANSRKASMPDVYDREDKENIKRHVRKAFDLAYPESLAYNPPQAKSQPSTAADREAWRNPVHPDNASLKPVAYYPILPDLKTVTDGGAFYSIKFDKPPLSSIQGRRDDRADVALLRAAEISSLMPAYNAKKAAYESNPDLYEDPGSAPFEWSYFVPRSTDPGVGQKVRTLLNEGSADKNNLSLYSGLYDSTTEKRHIDYGKVRTYPSVTEQTVDSARYMAIALFDVDTAPTASKLREQGSAAYYYPIYERKRMRADRSKVDSRSTAKNESDVDGLQVEFRDATPAEHLMRMEYRGRNDTQFAAEWEKIEKAGNAYKAELEAEKHDSEEAEAGTFNGAPDVSMGEADSAGEVDVPMNGVGRHRRDDDDDSMAED